MVRGGRSGIIDSDGWDAAFSRTQPGDEEAARAVEQAYERGLQEGAAAARQAESERYTRETETVLTQLSSALDGITTLRSRLNEEHLERMKTLALEAASKMLRARIEQDDPVAARALEEAVELLPEKEPLHVRLNPADMEAVRRELDSLIEQRGLNLEADESVERGGCIVRSDAGTVDATVESAEISVRAAVQGEDDR